jgi:hypothetical protein
MIYDINKLNLNTLKPKVSQSKHKKWRNIENTLFNIRFKTGVLTTSAFIIWDKGGPN